MIASVIYGSEEQNQLLFKENVFAEQMVVNYHEEVKLGSTYIVFAQTHTFSSLSKMEY